MKFLKVSYIIWCVCGLLLFAFMFAITNTTAEEAIFELIIFILFPIIPYILNILFEKLLNFLKLSKFIFAFSIIFCILYIIASSLIFAGTSSEQIIFLTIIFTLWHIVIAAVRDIERSKNDKQRYD